MKKYIIFLGICLISIFSKNVDVKAAEYCSRLYVENSNIYVLRDDNQILIENVEFNTTFKTLTVAGKDYYWAYFESTNNDFDTLLVWIGTQPTIKVSPLSNGNYRLTNAYTYNSTYPMYFIKIGHDNTITDVDKYLGSPAGNQWSYTWYFTSWGTSRADYILTLNDMDNDVDISYELNESNYCALPITIPEPTFSAEYTQYEGVNAAVNLTINFEEYDLEKYDYLISFNEGKNYQKINTSIDNEGNYTITRFYNFNVMAKVTNKTTGEEISSSYYEDSITPVEDYMIFFEDPLRNEYVTVDTKDYLYSKTLRISPRFLVKNVSYRVSFDGGETYQYFYDFFEKKVFKNQPVLVEMVDKYYQIIGTFNYGITGFEESVEVGEKIIFNEYEDPEDANNYIVYLRILNANSTNNYYVKYENSSYKKVYPLTWENGAYYFESTSTIKNYCARITDKNNEVIQEECYTIQGFTTGQNFSSFIKRIKAFIDGQKDVISDISDGIDEFFSLIPTPIYNLLVFIYFLACLTAIIWNIRR